MSAVAMSLRLAKGSGVSMISEIAGRGPCAPISRRVARTRPSHRPAFLSSIIWPPPSTGLPLLIAGGPSPCDFQRPPFTDTRIQCPSHFDDFTDAEQSRREVVRGNAKLRVRLVLLYFVCKAFSNLPYPGDVSGLGVYGG
ncbi:hypothetical protein FA13DRAFT_1521302 [Coprinellus micaceus]|uniref:Uncharacterized protein n=1 Tax=Coprinellus micaceus TaxID=71717 RepID=A0A4Y7SJU6_COPMI|nr:hypothetical protein FA13DRAFT_1521302 [Coprinellus micaceus]